MRTKAIIAGLGVALIAIPFITSAATITDLQSELQSLLSQIASLSVQGNTSSSISGSATLSGTVASSCPNFIRSLSTGARGSDVTALQQYLETQGDLNVSATGYFGSLTAAAVGEWQVQNGITTYQGAGFGMFGPLSRGFFSRNCGGTTTTAQSFSADPRSGTAPLNVTFTTSDSINSSSSYEVSFGDGSGTGSMTKGNCIAITAVVGGQGGIRCSYNVSHTYAANGTYTAQLLKQTPFACPSTADCAFPWQTVGTATVTVGSSTTAGVNFTASPTSGSAPLTVQFIATAPQGATLGNTVNFGDGSTGTLGFVPVCSSCSAEGTVTHTYASAGTYTATLTNNLCSCPANGICNCPNIPILGTATVTVGSTGSTPSATIVQLNAPGTATIPINGIAEVRNESFYFTLDSLTASTATIQVTPVGCWNSFPSDTPPAIRCMIAMIPIPPQTLSIGQTYSNSNYGVELTGIANNQATFSVTTTGAAATTVY